MGQKCQFLCQKWIKNGSKMPILCQKCVKKCVKNVDKLFTLFSNSEKYLPIKSINPLKIVRRDKNYINTRFIENTWKLCKPAFYWKRPENCVNRFCSKNEDKFPIKWR